jgi:hypothetical protein
MSEECKEYVKHLSPKSYAPSWYRRSLFWLLISLFLWAGWRHPLPNCVGENCDCIRLNKACTNNCDCEGKCGEACFHFSASVKCKKGCLCLKAERQCTDACKCGTECDRKSSWPRLNCPVFCLSSPITVCTLSCAFLFMSFLHLFFFCQESSSYPLSSLTHTREWLYSVR